MERSTDSSGTVEVLSWNTRIRSNSEIRHGYRGYNNLMVGESLSGRLLRSLLVLEGLALKQIKK